MSDVKKIRYVEGPTRVTVGDTTFKLGAEKVVDAEFGKKMIKLDFLKFEEVIEKVIKKKKSNKKSSLLEKEINLED